MKTLRVLGGLLHPGHRSVPPGQVRRVLVLEYLLPLGCCVHLTPLFEALKRCRPEMEITVATRGLGAMVLRHSPFVDHLIETTDPFVDLRGAARDLRQGMKKKGVEPDCVLTGASDQRSRIALLGLLASGAWRGGYTVHPGLYQRPLQNDPSRSLIANNLRLAEMLGCHTELLSSRVFFSAGDLAYGRDLIEEANPEGRPTVVFVTQNSGGQRTGWHIDRFVRVLQYAAGTLGCAVVYVGTDADRPAIEAIREAASGVGFSVAGRTSIGQLAALLALSDAMVSLDTGTMHVGRAVGAPMVVLGPSWQKPVEWLPLGVPNVRILRGEDRDTVPENYHLDEISAEAVMEALTELMDAYPASDMDRQRRVERSLSAVDHRRA